jgi:hypothetical protein
VTRKGAAATREGDTSATFPTETGLGAGSPRSHADVAKWAYRVTGWTESTEPTKRSASAQTDEAKRSARESGEERMA